MRMKGHDSSEVFLASITGNVQNALSQRILQADKVWRDQKNDFQHCMTGNYMRYSSGNKKYRSRYRGLWLKRESQAGSYCCYCCSAAQFDSLWPYGLQHSRLPCHLLSPVICSNSCPLNWWFHPTISSSVTPLLLLPSIFPSIKGFFQWVGSLYQVAKVLEVQLQHVLPMNIQDWFPLELTGLICLQWEGLSRVFSNTVVWKHQFFGSQPSLWSNSHLCMTTGKTITWYDCIQKHQTEQSNLEEKRGN